jgi:hypothetical protein
MPQAFILSDHAKKRMLQRRISYEWVAAALAYPDSIECDTDDPDLWHAIKAIPEKGFKKLRVVYKETARPWLVVTAFIE